MDSRDGHLELDGPHKLAAHPPRTLIIVRGNSGTGKSTVAAALRARYGRGLAIVGQDHLRRVVLWEHDRSDSPGAAPQLVAATALVALSNGYHVVVEGILSTTRYAAALVGLIEDHRGPSHVYYLDAPFEETARRHRTRPNAGFTVEQMAQWYRPHDLLGVPGEQVIDAGSTVDQTADRILATSRLTEYPPVTYCPVGCPRCHDER